MKRLAIALAVGAMIAGFGSVAMAQEGGESVVYKKRTIIDLTGAVIEGELTKPEGSYIVQRKLSRFSTLITTRQNFKFELEVSANEI